MKSRDSGPAQAINRGLDLATGDIVCWLNTDDAFWSTRTLERIVQLFEELPHVDVITGDGYYMDEYLGRYSAQQAMRHRVHPGITGWAQVNGRNALAWEEKFALDVWYVEHVSFLLDVKILLLTTFAVATRCGIAASGHATMTEFRGAKVER